jgi:hypothetical protein
LHTHTHIYIYNVRVQEESGVGEALDGASGREECAEVVAVQDGRESAGGAAGEQNLARRRHPDGEEVPDCGFPDALAPEIKPTGLIIHACNKLNRF